MTGCFAEDSKLPSIPSRKQPHLCSTCVVVFDGVRGFHPDDAMLGYLAETSMVFVDVSTLRREWVAHVRLKASPGCVVIL